MRTKATALVTSGTSSILQISASKKGWAKPQRDRRPIKTGNIGGKRTQYLGRVLTEYLGLIGGSLSTEAVKTVRTGTENTTPQEGTEG